MSADITYTDFGVTELKHIESGDHFLWSGNLYQKIDAHYRWELSEYHSRNAIQVQDGKAFYFYEEEAVVPVNIKIEVCREDQDKNMSSTHEDEVF